MFAVYHDDTSLMIIVSHIVDKFIKRERERRVGLDIVVVEFCYRSIYWNDIWC